MRSKQLVSLVVSVAIVLSLAVRIFRLDPSAKPPIEFVQAEKNPLTDAIEANQSLSSIKGLITADPTLLKKFDLNGLSALHYAVLVNRADLVRLLVDSGMDVNTIAPAGSYTFHVPPIACAAKLEVMKALVQCGAKTDYRDPDNGRSLIDHARDLGEDDIVLYLKGLAAPSTSNPDHSHF